METDRAQLRPRVLVVDDSPEVAQRLVEMLSEEGSFRVVGQAADGVRALELFQDTEPDAVVLDLLLPRLGGLEVLRAIRATGRDCLICILTNVSSWSAEETCLAAGADHFLRKAAEFDQVVSIMRARFSPLDDSENSGSMN